MHTNIHDTLPAELEALPAHARGHQLETGGILAALHKSARILRHSISPDLVDSVQDRTLPGRHRNTLAGGLDPPVFFGLCVFCCCYSIRAVRHAKKMPGRTILEIARQMHCRSSLARD